MSTNDNRKKVEWVTIKDDYVGQRIDNYLINQLKGVPKSAIYRMIRKGEVRINKGRTKPEYKLQMDDVVRIPPAVTRPEKKVEFVGDGFRIQIEQAILYEDQGLIVLNKPSGLAVHGGSGLNLGVIEALRLMRPNQRFLELVHRLDRDTSGCLLIAKKRSVLKELHEQMREGEIDKHYTALVHGRWTGLAHKIDAPLHKVNLASGERIVRVSPLGKPSLTEFKQLELFEGASLVEAKPITGRTHQIRVHAQFAGHAIAGDEKYLHRELNDSFVQHGLRRLFLHAHSIKCHVSGVPLEFSAPLPADLIAVLNSLRQS